MTNENIKEVKFAKFFIDELDKVHILLKDKDGEVVLSRKIDDPLFSEKLETLIKSIKE